MDYHFFRRKTNGRKQVNKQTFDVDISSTQVHGRMETFIILQIGIIVIIS